MSARILIVEDEPALVLTLSDRLRSEGYQVEAAETGDAGALRAREAPFDLILLDVALPGKSGFDVLRDLRQQRIDTPVLMLTARGQVVDRVLGLKLGADDYLAKPFDMMELVARIEAVLRRRAASPSTASGSYAFGDVRVDFRRAEVVRAGQVVPLSGMEWRLLCYFIEHRGALLTRGELLEKVWGYGALPQTRTVDVHVAALRQKLEADAARPRFFRTVHGRGYRFVP